MIISHDPTGGLTREKAYHALLDELFLPVSMVGLYLQHRKEEMWIGECCDSLGATAAFTLRLTESTLTGNSDCGIMGDPWFKSVKASKILAKNLRKIF
jgi:hypothetical protein